MRLMALPTTFDTIFARHAGSLPVNFLRALSKRESNMNPGEAKGPAWGLMQVVPVVRKGYNKRFGTNYTQAGLLDPDINVMIAAELLNRMVRAYGKHPDPNMHEDWNNPEFVALMLAGWNSGYSEAGGVGKVARYLEAKGIPVTHHNVFTYAGRAGATKNLQNPAKERWQRSVVELFYKNGGPGWGILGLVILAASGYALYRIAK